MLHRHLLKLLGIASLIVCCLWQDASAEPSKVGLVQEKPAEGRSVKTEQGYMVPYKMAIPGTTITFEMVPIPGGKFKMGSPESEKGHKADEGPQIDVEVEPFWMGKYEITWEEYKQYMNTYDAFKAFSKKKIRPVTNDNRIDAITAPTKLYDPSFTFEKGENPKQPAVTMTQYSAKQYTKWLSLLSGQFFRLPSEAEWEYACRAGTTTPYSFGSDVEKLGDYAWYSKNSDEVTHPVGQKKPNPWGLYDMHGNAAEWVLDAYSEDGYKQFEGKSLKWNETIQHPKKLFPRIVCGGSWEFGAEECRSASKLASQDEDWKLEDPNLPYSPWWFTSDPARGVTFRLLRPLKEVKREDQEAFWKADVAGIIDDVKDRLHEGRGAEGIVDPKLPEEIKKLEE